MLAIAWSILCESAPFILVGFLIADLLDAVLTGGLLVVAFPAPGLAPAFPSWSSPPGIR